MRNLVNSPIFFSENTISVEAWKLEQIADAARGLLGAERNLCAFIELDESGNAVENNCFLIVRALLLPDSTFAYEAVIIDEDKPPKLTLCSNIKK